MTAQGQWYGPWRSVPTGHVVLVRGHMYMYVYSTLALYSIDNRAWSIRARTRGGDPAV